MSSECKVVHIQLFWASSLLLLCFWFLGRVAAYNPWRCTTGKHTSEKPASKAAPSPNKSKQVSSGGNTSLNAAQAACIRCRQGFFCSDHGQCVRLLLLSVYDITTMFFVPKKHLPREREREFQKLCPCSKDFPLKRFMWFVGAKAGVAAAAQLSSQKLTSSEPIPKPVPSPVTKKASVPKVIDLNANQVCKHKGCGNTFTEKENHSTACHYHPGPAVFHDRSKGVKHAMPDCPWNICVEMYERQSLIHSEILRSQSCCLLDNVRMQFLC